MRINGFQTNVYRPMKNFKGEFRVVDRSTYTDQEQRTEIESCHAIYYPNKHESEADIRKAMREYTRHESHGGGLRPDGGVDRNGQPTYTQAWSYEEDYTCERGGRLPY